MLLVPLALVAVFALGAADAAPPTTVGNGQGNGNGNGNGNGRWGEVFQGSGNVTNTRCQGMSRGANCITPETRKEAARRAAAARAEAAGIDNSSGGGQ